MKEEWLVADVTPVGSADRAECDILVMIVGVFLLIQAALVGEEPLCDA